MPILWTPNMLSRRAGFLAVAAILLTGCDDGPAVVTDFAGAAGYDHMVAAAAKGPLLVIVRNPPFAVPAGAFDAALTDAMRGAVLPHRVRYTTDPAAAGAPSPRLVMLFNPVPAQSRQAICHDAIAPPQPEPDRPQSDRLTLVATLCAGKRLLVAVRGWAGGIDGPTHRRFRHLVRDATRAVFARPD